VKLLVEEAEDMGIKLGKDNIKVESRDDLFTLLFNTLLYIPSHLLKNL